MENKPNSNNKLFRWILIIFTLIMIGFGIHMASKTTAPWNKNKVKSEKWKVKN
ncbi:hypothetical protein [Sandaracinomonas limnophila]|uniref:hypothetical protein n=1 Tax=Sandaracinomonas limnophila TaxID=1862386 RepID=UPI0013E40B1A|nr:hypothetical protein [Sandaracinomonas limnophila]